MMTPDELSFHLRHARILTVIVAAILAAPTCYMCYLWGAR
jgi:hypothetical protein